MSGSRRRAVLTGCGLVAPIGADRGSLLAALVAGESALCAPARVAEGTPSPLPAGILVAEVADFRPERDLGEDANYRPLDRTARLLTVAASRVLADADADSGSGAAPDRSRARTGLAVGTTYGSLGTIGEFDRRQLTAGPRYVKPLDFANTVINAAAGQAAIWFGLEGTNATFAGGTPAALEAISFAADQVCGGRADLLLAGGAEELAAESVLAYARAGLLAGAEGAAARPIPFAAGRNGLALGEGAALLAIEEAGRARSRSAAILASVAGFGSAFGDDESAVRRAVEAALADAGIEPRDLGVWVASANGSRELDRREAWGVSSALGGAAPPVTAPKLGFGESLGASGALAVALLVAIFESGVIPGMPGVPGLPGASQDDELPPLSFGPTARPVAARFGLVTGLGLDGDVAALILERGESQ